MVGTHRYATLLKLLNIQKSLHHIPHRNISFEVVILLKVALCVASCRAQVNEADSLAKLTHHRWQVVVTPHAKRACAEAQAIRLVGYCCNNLAKVICGGHNSWQTQYWVGWVVGVDNHLRAALISHRTNLLEEVDKVLAQTLCVNILVAVKSLLELLHRKALLRARQASYHIASKQVAVILAHLLKAGFSLRLLLG